MEQVSNLQYMNKQYMKMETRMKKQGGLGVSNLQYMNTILLMKMVVGDCISIRKENLRHLKRKI